MMVEATTEAGKHACRCEALAALLAEARDKLEQAQAAEAERAREAAAVAEAEAAAAAAAAAEAAAAEAAERLQMEEEMAALTLRMQQVQARLGIVPPPPPSVPVTEDNQCVVCMDAVKDRIVLPCMHICACEACAQHLQEQDPARCPVCRGSIERIKQVFS